MGCSVKRRIPFTDISGITVSKLGPEFVIHVPKEYDYRFSSPDFKELIFQNIAKGYSNKNKKLAFWFKDDINL
jgi:hypothetical protein